MNTVENFSVSHFMSSLCDFAAEKNSEQASILTLLYTSDLKVKAIMMDYIESIGVTEARIRACKLMTIAHKVPLMLNKIEVVDNEETLQIEEKKDKYVVKRSRLDVGIIQFLSTAFLAFIYSGFTNYPLWVTLFVVFAVFTEGLRIRSHHGKN